MGNSSSESVELLPQHQRTRGPKLLDRRDILNVIRQLHRPVIPLGNVVEIPDGRRSPAFLARHDGQASALRKAGALQPKPESSEVRLITGCSRIAAPRTHCCNELVLGHSLAVIYQ